MPRKIEMNSAHTADYPQTPSERFENAARRIAARRSRNPLREQRRQNELVRMGTRLRIVIPKHTSRAPVPLDEWAVAAGVD